MHKELIDADIKGIAKLGSRVEKLEVFAMNDKDLDREFKKDISDLKKEVGVILKKVSKIEEKISKKP